MSIRMAAWLAICAAMAGSGAMAAVPGGSYAILIADKSDQYAVAAQALQVPGVDGLLIHLRWDEISPSFEQYDWTLLDQAVQVARAAHKRFEIGIVTGSATPSWVIDGATHATFAVDAVQGQGCTSFVMAAPYDPAYLAAFDDLLRQLAAHLRATGAYPKLAMLKITPMTTTTNELRLPALAECGGDAVATWQSLGYTQDKVRSAWNQTLQSYLKYFPTKSFNIGFIGINAFPAIRADGSVAATPKAAKAVSARFAAALIADAGAATPGRLALGFDSLTLNLPEGDESYRHSKRQFFADAAGANARLGWQTNELLGQYPGGGAACGGSTHANAVACTSSDEFKAMLFRGLYPRRRAGTPPSLQGVYLELFPQNITAFPDAVRAAHRNLGGWVAP